MVTFPTDVFLLTLRPFDPAAGARVPLYVADAVYRNLPTDSPANLLFLDALADFRFDRNAYRPGAVGGPALPGRMAATINRAALPAAGIPWLGYRWGGHPYTLERVPAGSAYADRVMVARGTMAALEQTGVEAFTLSANDPGEDLATALQSRLYAGTGDFEGPVELQGRSRPVVVGEVPNVEGVLVDPSGAGLWLDWHDGKMTSIGAARDKGGELTATATFPPDPGEIWHDLVRGRSKLGRAPIGAVTADVVGAAAYENLLSDPEDFTAWSATDTGAAVLTVTANAGTAPDGATTADRLSAAGGTGKAGVDQLVAVEDCVHALSVHATPAAGDWLLLTADRDDAPAGGRFGAYFNVTTGETGATIAEAGASDVQAYMIPVREGGYRCVVSGELPTGMSSLRVHVSLAGDDEAEEFEATGQSVDVWGAMLNEGAVAEPYTTGAVNAPMTLAGACRYLLGRFGGELYPAAFDTAALAALDVARPGVVGRAIGTEAVDLSAVIDQLVDGQACFRWYNRAGLFSVKALAAPTVTSATDAAVRAVLTDYDVRRGTLRRIVPGIPPWRVVPRYYVLGLAQQRDTLVDEVTAADRLKWSTPTLAAPPIESRAILRAYPRSRPLEPVTYLRDQSPATAIGEALADVLDGLVLFAFEALTGFGSLEIGDEVWFAHPDAGHADGIGASVVGITEVRRGLIRLEIMAVE